MNKLLSRSKLNGLAKRSFTPFGASLPNLCQQHRSRISQSAILSFHLTHDRYIIGCCLQRRLQGTSTSDGGQKLGQISGKLAISFTCKVCGTRSEMKMMSKRAYTEGVVIIKCEKCENNHLIADNLGWFSEKGKTINVETLMKEKGEIVRKDSLKEKIQIL